MRFWSRKTWVGVLGASMVLGSLAACSSGHPHGSPMSVERMAHMRGKVVERISSKLDLDGPQKLKLNALADKIEAQRMALRGNEGPRAQMQGLVAGTTFDRIRAQALVDDKMGALQASAPDVIAAVADFYDSLNPGQQQKVREMMEHTRKGWMTRD